MLNPIPYVIRFFLHVCDVSIRTQFLSLSFSLFRNRRCLCDSLPTENHLHAPGDCTRAYYIMSPMTPPPTPLSYFKFFFSFLERVVSIRIHISLSSGYIAICMRADTGQNPKLDRFETRHCSGRFRCDFRSYATS